MCKFWICKETKAISYLQLEEVDQLFCCVVEDDLGLFDLLFELLVFEALLFLLEALFNLFALFFVFCFHWLCCQDVDWEGDDAGLFGLV